MHTNTGSFCRPEEWKVRVGLGYDRAEGWPVRTTSMQTETDGNMPADIYFVVVDVIPPWRLVGLSTPCTVSDPQVTVPASSNSHKALRESYEGIDSHKFLDEFCLIHTLHMVFITFLMSGVGPQMSGSNCCLLWNTLQDVGHKIIFFP